jgi:hypothetical protein
MEIISPADRVKMEQQLKELFAQRPVITARIAEARAKGVPLKRFKIPN